MSKNLIYLVGLPCVGKSSLINKKYADYVVISNDIIVEEYAAAHNIGYNEAWHKISFKYVKAECMRRFNKAVKENKNIIIDNTNMTVKARKSYQHPDYIKTAIVFQIDDEEHQRRIKKRLNETGKLIPEDAVKRMKENYVEPSKAEGFEKIIYINS